MKSKSATTKTLLVVAAILAVAGLVGYYFYFNHIKADGEMASSLQNEIDLLSEKTTKLGSIKSILADTAVDRAKLAKAAVSADGNSSSFAASSGSVFAISSATPFTGEM